MQRRLDRPLLKVLPWAPGTLAATAIRADATPLVLGIAAPDSTIRDTARGLARNALREALGMLLERPPQDVPLISQPGQPIRLDLPGQRIGLSVSHEPGLTLAAVHVGQEIGIDLMRVDQRTDWVPDWKAVARDYLGPHTADRIARLPQDNQAQAFARAWTGLEASLKCHEMPLQEWSHALERKLTRCRLFDLDLPEGFVGTLAVA